jgi:hypothetical protein
MHPSVAYRRSVPRRPGRGRVISIRTTVNVSPDVLTRVHRVVFHTRGMTVFRFTEEALLREVLRHEKSRGKPFPKIPRTEHVRRGRPVGRT